MTGSADALFERPRLKRAAPNRTAGNFYRSASSGGRAVGGVPLDSVEAAATAAVRMGYKIAAAQIDRTARFAKRMRDAGDAAAGPASDRLALDATEQLVFNAMMAALGWLEGVAADPGNPVKRFATAEFRLLGSLLGLTPFDRPGAPGRPDPGTATADQNVGQAARVARSATHRSGFSADSLRIVHTGPAANRRAVQVRRWSLAPGIQVEGLSLVFHRAAGGAATLTGKLRVTPPADAVLTLRWSRKPAAGTWKAPICDSLGMQVGYVEIEL
jgi:hypothetical protein